MSDTDTVEDSGLADGQPHDDETANISSDTPLAVSTTRPAAGASWSSFVPAVALAADWMHVAVSESTLMAVLLLHVKYIIKRIVKHITSLFVMLIPSNTVRARLWARLSASKDDASPGPTACGTAAGAVAESDDNDDDNDDARPVLLPRIGRWCRRSQLRSGYILIDKSDLVQDSER